MQVDVLLRRVKVKDVIGYCVTNNSLESRGGAVGVAEAFVAIKT